MRKRFTPLQWLWIAACAAFAVVQSFPPFSAHGNSGFGLIGSALGGGLFGAITAAINRKRIKDDKPEN